MPLDKLEQLQLFILGYTLKDVGFIALACLAADPSLAHASAQGFGLTISPAFASPAAAVGEAQLSRATPRLMLAFVTLDSELGRGISLKVKKS